MKFTDPTGNGVISLSQTYHGETHKLPDTQCAIDISMSGGEYFHSVCDGVVELTTTTGGGYISVIPDNLNARVLYVHTTGWLVSKGQRVTAGQRLGLISKTAPTHLHIGMKNKDNSANPPRIMDYFDRSLNFQTNYADIKAEWFIDGKLNWSLFQDLQYGSVVPPVDPRIAELEKQVANLQIQNGDLSNELKLSHERIVSLVSNAEQSEKEYQELSDKYGTLVIEKKTAINDKEEAIRLLMALKSSRFFWVLEMLEKLFPKKN